MLVDFITSGVKEIIDKMRREIKTPHKAICTVGSFDVILRPLNLKVHRF